MNNHRSNSYYDSTKPHHRPDGFQNNYTPFRSNFMNLLRWRWNATRNGLPPAPRTPVPSVAPDLEFIHANASAGVAMRPAVTWIGHATALAQFGGLTMLTDPVFSQRVSPFRHVGPRRHAAPGVAMHQLPHIDLVLISHNHYDHLDEESVDFLNRQPGGAPLFVVPLGLKPWLSGRGIRHAVELDWWDTHCLPTSTGNAEIVLVPAQHWSGRTLTDRMKTLWGGFAVFSDSCHLLYTGDTGYSPDFADIRKRFAERQTPRQGGGFDIALIPIGAYEPRWFMATQHVNPEEALKIHRDVGAKRSLGIHWGTFALTDEALDEPARVLAAQRRTHGVPDDEFFTIAIGETHVLPLRSIPMK